MTILTLARAPEFLAADARMLEALLASCDPCGAVADGADTHVYAETADRVLLRLRAGGDQAAVMLAVPPEADAAAALRFAHAALSWWRHRRGGDVPAHL